MIIVSIMVLLAACAVCIRMSGYRLTRPYSGELYDFEKLFSVSGMSIVWFTQGEKVYYFLVDTGCSDSVLSDKCGAKCVYLGDGMSMQSADGQFMNTFKVSAKFERDGREYEHQFNVGDISGMTDKFETTYRQFLDVMFLNKDYHFAGILGGDFLSKYNWVIDYSSKMIYGRNAK